MAITPRTNPNFEKVGSIKIVSAGKPTDDEQRGFIFGGLGYTASVDVNDGNGYTITINVVSKDGEYYISEKDLNATSAGAKNIQIGNFIFFDFFLVSYSIQKQVENSILVLTYKDKSIFMDKIYIGLLHHEHGISLASQNGIVKESKPTSITKFTQTINFDYKCDKSNQDSNPITIPLKRDLYTVFTYRNSSEFQDFRDKTKDSILNLVNSPYFYSKYDYAKNGVNGGFIILGSEEFKESLCALRDTSYTFRDLLSALFYSKIPGIRNMTLPKNDIFKSLRKNYFGSLRDVLSNWSSDIGIRFYYQPKIQYKTRDYNNLDLSPSANFVTIQEGLKYLDPNSGPESLKRLNTFLRSNDGKILKKVIQNINETASLEGTVKSSVITSIRREARVFPKSIESVFTGFSNPLDLSNIPPFFGVSPITDNFLIRATLAKYDEELRDIYALNNIAASNDNAASLGISSYLSLFEDSRITNNLDFLALFGEELGSPSAVLDNYKAYLVKYDPSKHEAIKNWERSVIDEFYNQYYSIPLNTEQKQFCGDTSNFNIQFDTEPPSQRYSANELPFKNLLYNKSQLTLLNNQYNQKKTSPLFQANNPFDDRNETTFNTFVSRFSNDTYSTKKSLKIIDLYSNASARNALLMCANPNNFTEVFNFLNQPNTYVIVCPSLSYGDFASTISLTNSINLSVLEADKVASDSEGKQSQCNTTVCEQSIDDIGCRDPNSSKAIYTGFIGTSSIPIGTAKAVKLTKAGYDHYLILPTLSPYRYAVTRQINSTTTFSAQNYVLGSLPEFPSDPKANTSEYNVLGYSCVRNPVPEILTQIESEAGVQDKIITFNDDRAPGARAIITDALTFHNVASKQINNSIVEPFQTKSFSLTSTYIPTQLQSYIFDNPILSSMNFQLGTDGFNMSFTFQSRPKETKSLDSIFQTQQFLEVL